MARFNVVLKNFPCDLCGREDEELLYTKNGVLTNHPFKVVRCRSCGLIYLNPRLGEQALLELYDRSYYDGKGFDAHVHYLSDFDKEKDIDKVFRPEDTVKLITEIVPPPSMLLDFGCGLGDHIRQATKYGYEAEGFEVSHFAREFARAKGAKVYGRLDQLPQNHYNIVTAIEVLEHCSSPTAALSAIYRCLRPGGIFYYTTANFDGFYLKWRMGIKDSLNDYIVPEGHIHFFSKRVMKSYFKKIGFSKAYYYERKSYPLGGRFLKLLSTLHLKESGDTPNTWRGKLSYYGVRKAAIAIGLRKGSLPLAIK